MAREGKKLELYEVLAAKRAQGKTLPGFDARDATQANTPDPGADSAPSPEHPGVIVDDAVREQYQTTIAPPHPQPQAPAYQTPFPQPFQRERAKAPKREPHPQPAPQPAPPPEPPKPRSPREVVFALDTAFIFFTVVLALVGCSYFLGYKRGQEERPAGMAGLGEIDVVNPDRVGIRNLSPAPRATMRPPEQDFTLVLRTESASDDLPERLELELAEAVAKGRQQSGVEVQGFIFRTGGNDPRYVLTVGLARTATDAELNRLLEIYYKMEGMTLSRELRPYVGARIAPVRELGAAVY